jgi:ring-1,2-phenylacetyl-CoA epoxidase subunit PaaE
MSKFYSLKVTDVKPETDSCVSVGLEVPENLKKEFHYIQGQYLTLRFRMGGDELRRSYSICSSPLEAGLRIAVKKVKEGKISTLINEQLKAGDPVESMVPVGNFYTELKAYNKKSYNLFAAGSGITPVISILKTTLGSETQAQVNLFYGNSDENHIIFKNELDQLKQLYKERLQIHYTFSRPAQKHEALFTGRMSKEKVLDLVKKFVNLSLINEFFICGPADMMAHCREALESLGVLKNKIHYEYFGIVPETAQPTSAQNQAVPAEITIICDGDERVVFIEPHQSVLEAALEANLDAPFACRAGSCCTCRAKLIEGKVMMDVNYALLDSEVEQGYILTCQSHALTPTLTVDYDQGK